MSNASQNHLVTKSTEMCLQVLRYWHQLEFFSPYNLDDALSTSQPPVELRMSSLQSDKAHRYLPWLNTKGLFHYQLYLLPFDKKELTALSAHYFPLNPESYNTIAIEETLDDEGLTCFARLFIDKNGQPKWSDFSVSTLPWAMGMMQSGDFEQLCQARYDEDMYALQSALKLIEAQYDNSATANSQGQFDAKLLIQLLNILCQWAHYSPDFPFVVAIQEIPAKQEQESLPKTLTAANALACLPTQVPFEEKDDDLPAIDKDESLAILNSFFIKDMEKALNYLANQNHPLLELYINGCKKKVDILHHDNQEFLLEQLKPRRSNLGRWPVSEKNMMSLMQQVGINQSILTKKSNIIIATNGPPGTGKTTLLKDIIAENIVQRALILSEFSSVTACFSSRKKIVFGNDSFAIDELKPELTGFEMLVVSSNNTAVENITRELPLKSSLGDHYQDSCHYLRAVAAKISASHSKQSIKPLSSALQPWGLIAVALGNSSNCNEFIQKFFFSPERDEKLITRVTQGDYLTIWEWRKQYTGLSFAEAKIAFLDAKKAVDNYQENLQKLADSHHFVTNNPYQQEIIKQQQRLLDIKGKSTQLINDKSLLKQEKQLIEQQQKTLLEHYQQQLNCKPSWWKTLIRAKEAIAFNTIMNNLQNRRVNLFEKIMAVNDSIEDLNKQLIDLKTEHLKVTEQLKYSQIKQQEIQQNYERLKLNYPKINTPESIITDNDHVISYWQSTEFNHLRNVLFIQALQLHQAWLAETLQKKYFSGNLFAIKALLEGKFPLVANDALAIWQSFFMIIPVVSSTFASITRLFKHVSAQSLGCLLIDEAGQATPQAAIGALWRFKKAIIVGDPRQIEPIMPIPPSLIEGFAKYHFKKPSSLWLPHVTSIQTLADQASSLGSMIQLTEKQTWAGIPLLVHRRCLDPMFSIANDIAYDNKMINARQIPISKSNELPISSWFDVQGAASKKQFVPAQTACLLHLFIWFYNHDKGLPRVFIISPFKQVVINIKQLIGKQVNWINQIDSQLPVPNSREIQQWLQRHVGTVHTFQGKESEKVIFILGADAEQKGAINWASSKPNLLNVALTRATDRIYFIGDWELWANKPFFSQASALLKREKWAELVNEFS